MRMWYGVPPNRRCDHHLLGEHNELHMVVGAVNKQKNLGKLLRGCVNPRLVFQRHNEVVSEMKQRGMKHNTPIDEWPYNVDPPSGRTFSAMHNQVDLISRCSNCAARAKTKGAA